MWTKHTRSWLARFKRQRIPEFDDFAFVMKVLCAQQHCLPCCRLGAPIEPFDLAGNLSLLDCGDKISHPEQGSRSAVFQRIAQQPPARIIERQLPAHARRPGSSATLAVMDRFPDLRR